MKNNKGQVLVLFVILIPIFVLIAAFTIDMGYNFYESNKLDNINKMVIKYGLKHLDKENLKAKLIDLLHQNDSDIKSYSIYIDNNKITVNINKTIDSVFGKIINIDTYHLSSTYKGSIIDDRIFIEKG